jgi:hypothetical protein
LSYPGRISNAQRLARPWSTGEAYRNPVVADMAATEVDWANPPKEGSMQQTPGYFGGRKSRRTRKGKARRTRKGKARRTRNVKANRRTSKK